jgi:hypothetical protein
LKINRKPQSICVDKKKTFLAHFAGAQNRETRREAHTMMRDQADSAFSEKIAILDDVCKKYKL